jgi:rubredoxin
MQTSPFERTASAVDATHDSHFECGICWEVYDPAAGDALRQIAPGTPFAALSADWTCPRCDAPREKFMVLGDD